MNSQTGCSVRTQSLPRLRFCDIALVVETEPEERGCCGPSGGRWMNSLILAPSDRIDRDGHNLPVSRQ
jgi:hypothetical protein